MTLLRATDYNPAMPAASRPNRGGAVSFARLGVLAHLSNEERRHASPARCVVLSAALIYLAFACPSPAQEQSAEQAAAKPADLSPRERIERALERPIQVEFDQTPLNEAVRELGSKAGAPILLDLAALERYDQESTAPLRLPTTTAPLRAVLERMLEGSKLAWGVQDGVLVVTTPEIPPAELEKLTRALIAPDAWQEPDAYLKIVPGRIVVKHRPEVVRAVRAFAWRLDLEGLPPGGFGGMGGGIFNPNN